MTEHFHRGDHAAEIAAALEPGEHSVRQPPLEPVARRPVADDQNAVAHLAAFQLIDRVRKHVQPLFHDQPADEADRDLVVGDPERATPFEVAAAGIEDLAIDAPAPDADIEGHALIAQQLRHRFGRRDDRVAAPIEAAQHRFDDRLQEGEAIIAGVRLEPGMDRRDDRHAAPTRQADGAVAEDFRAGDVDHVRREGGDVASDRERNADRRAIFGAPRNGDRRHPDDLADRGEGGRVGARRIHPDRGTLTQQIADQAVQRLIGAIADVVIIAAEQRDAKLGHVHRGRLPGNTPPCHRYVPIPSRAQAPAIPTIATADTF